MSKELLKKQIRYGGAVKRVFDLENPDVRVVLKEWIKRTNIFTPTFVAGDPHRTAFNEGQRRIVCSLLAHIHNDPTKLIEQLKHLENETES